MAADAELPGIITQNHGIAQEFVCLNATPTTPPRWRPDRVRGDLQRVEAQPVEMPLRDSSLNRVCGLAFRRAIAAADRPWFRMES